MQDVYGKTSCKIFVEINLFIAIITKDFQGCIINLPDRG
jgi:hypothetical protein